MRSRYLGAVVGVVLTAGALATALSASASNARLSKPIARSSSMHVFRPFGYTQHGKPARPVHSKNLYYHGGVSDGLAGTIGVETAPKVYLVLWGSQWTSNDPSGESSILQNFLNNVGGNSWLNSVTQYCQGVASRTYFCNGAGTAAGNPAGILNGVWSDNGSAAPSSPSQSQLASEAVNAAAHFGNTTTGSNASTQYVIATATGNNASGFETQYCAWHSSTSSLYGDIAYTNLPYIADAGILCGANFVNSGSSGATDGITIVDLGRDGRHHDRRGPRARGDDHRPVPERRLARQAGGRERRQMRLDQLRPGRRGGRELWQLRLSRPVALE